MRYYQYYMGGVMESQAISRLTGKYQATIPAPVRAALCLTKGDAVLFTVDDEGQVTLTKAVPLDAVWVSALSATMEEWESPEDEEAFGGL